ncbi:MAG: hypothetical protein KC656_32450, partial [Myxococcales bacterium]|nr:hypothetical protein [Myxococcales bacterium]
MPQRLRVGALVVLPMSGCLLGAPPDKDYAGPQLLEPPRLLAPSEPSEDGTLRAREGTEVVVELRTSGRVDLERTSVSLGGHALRPVARVDEHTFRYARLL